MSSSGVVAVESVEQYIEFFRAAIQAKLGKDREALKAFDVTRYQPTTADQKQLTAAGMGNILNVNGALGLDDSGVNWRAFSVQIEEGLSKDQDTELADSLAHQCLICVAQMKKIAKAGGNVHHVN